MFEIYLKFKSVSRHCKFAQFREYMLMQITSLLESLFNLEQEIELRKKLILLLFIFYHCKAKLRRDVSSEVLSMVNCSAESCHAKFFFDSHQIQTLFYPGRLTFCLFISRSLFLRNHRIFTQIFFF